MKYEIMIRILFLLLSRGKLTAKYLADKFDLSTRTIMRYLDAISLANVPLLSETGRNGGYYIADSYKLPANFMTEEEFDAVISSLNSYNEQLGSETLSSAIDKLVTIKGKNGGVPEIKAGHFIIDGSTWNGESNEKEVISLVEKAIENSTLLEIRYVARNGESTVRKIEPHLIILKQGLWYVYAYCRLRNEFRTFKLARINYATLTGETFEKRKTDYSPLSYDNWIGSAESEFIDLEVSPAAKPEIEEWLGVNAVYKKGDSYFASARLPYDGWLVSKILSFSGTVKVLSPQKLKADVLAAAREVISEYDK